MRSLGQLEAAVMQRLWDWSRAASVREVLEDLQRDRAIAYTTVMTVLDNLHGKRLVTREKAGRAWLYTPTLSREQHTAGLIEDVLSTAPDRGTALLNLVGRMSAQDVAELRRLLAEIDEGPTP